MSDLTCSELVELASDYLDEMLDDDPFGMVTDHLICCPDCTNYLSGLQATIRLVSQLPPDRLPDALESSLLDRHREWVGTRSAV